MKRLRSVFLRTMAWLLVVVVGVYVVVSSSSVVALSSSSLPRRALQQTTEETEDEDKTSIGMYVMIPFVCGLVGYATNVLALKMTFYPLEFYPRCLKFAQVPGQPFGLLGGWQGIIPSKAGKMAEILVDLMTEKLIDVKETFAKLDSQEFAHVLKQPLRRKVREQFEEVMTENAPDLWLTLPEYVKNEIVETVMERSPLFLKTLIDALKDKVYEVLDLKSMVIRLAEGNKDKVVQMFKDVGESEFRFIEVSGLYFGFLFGLIQMGVFYVVDQNHPEYGIWMLPLFGFATGYLTNWVALTVIFKPVEPIHFFGGCYTLHGVFLKRQVEVSAEFSRLNFLHFCNAENLWDEMMHGTFRGKFESLIRKSSREFFDSQAGVTGKYLTNEFLGKRAYENITDKMSDLLVRDIEHIIPHSFEYQDEALEIEVTVSERMGALRSAEFERVLHPVFEQDEIKLIVVGGVLGAAVGVIQYYAAFGGS